MRSGAYRKSISSIVFMNRKNTEAEEIRSYFNGIEGVEFTN